MHDKKVPINTDRNKSAENRKHCQGQKGNLQPQTRLEKCSHFWDMSTFFTQNTARLLDSIKQNLNNQSEPEMGEKRVIFYHFQM